MDSLCPDVQSLIDYASQVAAGEDRNPVERHVAACLPCRETLARALELEGEDAGARVPAHTGRLRTPWKRGAAAAAGILLLLGGLLVFLPRREPEVFRGPAVVPFVSVGEIRLPDGSVVRLSEGARTRAVPLASGERFHLFLEEGELRAEVRAGKGAFRIQTPAGEIQVLGTRFRVEAVRLGKEVTCVDVYDGKVLLRNGHGETLLGGPVSGVSVMGAPPAKLEPDPDWDEVLKRMAR